MNLVGLDAKKSAKLANELNDLLANYMTFYQNARGLHWNIKGHKFFELHLKFEELYNDLLVKVDEVAERILTLGSTPLHTFEDFSNASKVKVMKHVSEPQGAVSGILEAFKILLQKQRIILDLSDDAEDEGTNALMSDYIREQEKLVWMYSAYLNEQ